MTLIAEIEQQAVTRVCRFCRAGLKRTFVDLGMSPLCETYPSAADLNRGEVYYPLHVYVCEQCFLVQLEEYEKPENIFSDYPYFSSFSDSWLRHAENYCEKMVSRFALGEQSLVVEVASNDGYLLQYFVRRHVPVLGIEPAANVAKVAVEKGVPTLVKFFGTQLAKELAAEGRKRRPGSRQQCVGAGPGSERFCGRAEDSAETRGRPDSGVPPPAAADRTQRV